MSRADGFRRLYLAAAVVLLTGCGRANTPATATDTQTVGDLRVTLATTPTPHTGDNMLSVTLADTATGAPVGNANITATPTMLAPRLPGAPTSGRAQGNGLYLIPVRLGVATQYRLELHIQRTGKPAADAAFPIEAAQ